MWEDNIKIHLAPGPTSSCCEFNSTPSGYGPVAGPCEHNTEPFDSIQEAELLDEQNSYKLFKKYPES